LTINVFMLGDWYIPTKANGYVARNGTNTDDVILSYIYSHYCHWMATDCSALTGYITTGLCGDIYRFMLGV